MVSHPATMTIFRVEIRNRGGQVSRTHGDVSYRERRLFFLQGNLTQDEAAQICREILVDPVVEDYDLTAEDGAVTPDAHTIDVTLLPGVTDPAADNLVRAAHEMGITGLHRAATGHRYVIDADLDDDILAHLAKDVFANVVIQRYSVNVPISAPFVTVKEADDTVEIIPLKDADDKRLMQISMERRLSLDLNEMQAIRDYFASEDRDPTDAELEMLAQTWSEHCVHKTFKAKIDYTGPDGETITIDGILDTYLRAATEKVNKDWVLSAFVDNAGIIKFDDEWDIAFKAETHNRPSALEPFGGANTGVGGVIRDVLGVSARPIANTDILCFGMPDTPEEDLPEGVLHPRRIAEGVVAGIEDYGNKMGIPTVNGAIHYHPGYTSNPLVFCGCVGILPHGSHRTEAQPGDLIVVIGGRTGRDGLRGATFSSMEMDATTGTVSGGAVQIGNPIEEKKVMEVVLRARDEKLYNAITDCGAGGLSSAVGEMGEKIGATVQLQAISLKYPGLQPWEIWLSEAQERMVFAVPPENWERMQAICAGQNVEATAIGTYESTGRLTLHYGEKQVGDLSMVFLHDGIPQKHLKAEWKAPDLPEQPTPIEGEDYGETLLKLLAMPTIRSKEDVIRRYDHEVQGGTAVKPLVGVHDAGPSDAAVLIPREVSRPLTPKSPLPQGERGLEETLSPEKLNISVELHKKMTEIARRLRRDSTKSEKILWKAIRKRQLNGRKFRRQQPIGVFVVDFYCADEHLVVEVDGGVHESQRETDEERQSILESLGLRFIRFTADDVENDLDNVLNKICASFSNADTINTSESSPSPLVGEGEPGGEGESPTRGIALAVGMCPQYTELDPYAMAWAAIDEAIRNLVAVGADPDQIAILDNFSWGNTNLPDRLGALVRCAQGCHDAAVHYGVPFISGKDSLNNEYLGADGERHAIPGTLVISAIGIVPDVNKTVTMDLKSPGSLLYVIGETRDETGASHYNLLHGVEGGTVPQPKDNALEMYRALHKAIQAGLVQSCHDVSEGGLAVALAEMCIASGLGANVDWVGDKLFSETSGRFIVEVSLHGGADFDALDLPYQCIGEVALNDESCLSIKNQGVEITKQTLNDLERAWHGEITRPTNDAGDLPVGIFDEDSRIRTMTTHAMSTRPGKPKVLILHANGTNRDHDAMLACELAGGEPEIVHVNQLVANERNLLEYHMLVVPGGFSYGDDLGAGVLWASDLRRKLGADLQRFIDGGRPVLGICNGFQTLVKAGILPDANWSPQTPNEERPVTLTYNQHGGFECRWVYLQPVSKSQCVFTQDLVDPIHCPVAHGEGRVVAKDDIILRQLINDGLAPLIYVDVNGRPAGYPVNPNGSGYNIAGLCNPMGNVFGLMPHPENHIFPWQHPRYRRGEQGMDGLRLFKNGIKYS